MARKRSSARRHSEPSGRDKSTSAVRWDLLIALLLPPLALAVFANFPGASKLQWPVPVLRAGLLLGTIILLVWDAPPRWLRRFGIGGTTDDETGGAARRGRTVHVGLAAIVLLAVASYYNFGRFHRDGQFLHYHEHFHYYLGSKYFDALGYDGLYAAAHLALLENEAPAARQIGVVKNLRTYELEAAQISVQRAQQLKRSMTTERWRAFREDIAFFATRIQPEHWQFALIDHGYNATPFWNALGSAFSRAAPASAATLYALSLIDLVLIAGMLLLVGYACGLRAALLFAIFFFASFFATFQFTGGAFLRQLWLAGVVGFVCCVRLGWMIPAGIALALAIGDRAFPAVFLFWPAVMWLRETRQRGTLRHGYTRFFLALGGALALVGLFSLETAGGVAAWQGWYANISAHNQWFYINQIALRNLFVVNPLTAAEMIETGWDEARWLRERTTLDAANAGLLTAVRLAVVVGLGAVLLRVRQRAAGLALLAFLPFVLFYPANYYGILLAVVVICWQFHFNLALALLALQVPILLLSAFLEAPAELELLHWIVALALTITFCAFLAAPLVRAAREDAAGRRLALGMGGIVAVLLLGGFVLRLAPDGGQDVIEQNVIRQDLTEVRGATPRMEEMVQFGTAWLRNDHVAFAVEQPDARATIRLPATSAGDYRLKLDFTTAAPFGILAPAVNGADTGVRANLYRPTVGVQAVVLDDVRLDGGTNALSFQVVGRDPAAAGMQWAIDRILVQRTEHTGPSADAAYAQALGWLRRHPADTFDGGVAGICGELIALHVSASRTADAVGRDDLVEAVAARLRRLEAIGATGIPPEEYELWVVAAYIAGQFELPFETFAAHREEVAAWARTAFARGDGNVSLMLCQYLARLDLLPANTCEVERTFLFREHRQRRLVRRLATPPQAAQAADVTTLLLTVAAEVAALTDFGRQAPPDTALFRDVAFWRKLCGGGLRWGRELGDVVLTGRLLLLARSVDVGDALPEVDEAVAFLLRHQEPDGSFGATSPQQPNPRRDAVLAALLGLSGAAAAP